jgi:peptide/nickel transport system permease protein
MSTLPPGEFAAEVTANQTTFETPNDRGNAAVVGITSRTPAQLAWRRFREDRKTVAAGVIVAIYVVLAVLAPVLVSSGVLDPYSVHQNLINANGLPIGNFGGISAAHPLGVEPGIGRDTMSRIWLGLSLSLFISAAAAVFAVVVGVVLGIIAGMSRRWADTVIGRAVDLVLCFPQTLMLLALSGLVIAWLTGTLHVPAGTTAQATYVILVLGIFGWPSVTRIIRGQVISLREREFIDAARLLGARNARLYFKEVLPNLWAPILVQFTLILPAYVSAEAALSYLGISVLPPTPTLGNTLAGSIQYASSDPLFFATPAFLLVLVVVSFNLLGDGLRDALDPRSSR